MSERNTMTDDELLDLYAPWNGDRDADGVRSDYSPEAVIATLQICRLFAQGDLSAGLTAAIDDGWWPGMTADEREESARELSVILGYVKPAPVDWRAIAEGLYEELKSLEHVQTPDGSEERCLECDHWDDGHEDHCPIGLALSAAEAAGLGGDE